MKKLFTLLTSLVLISSGTSQIIACSDNAGATNPDKKFDLWNLSTWGNTQKQIIEKSYLESAKSWYQQQSFYPKKWGYWNDNGEQTATNKAFQLVNSVFNLNYVFYGYQPLPSGDSDLKQVLANGVNLIMKAVTYQTAKPFTGELTMTIKGNI